MDAVTALVDEYEVDPWNVNLDKLSRNLKDGIDLNKVVTTGASIEIMPNKSFGREQSQDKGISLNEYRNVCDHLLMECAGDDDDNNTPPFSKMAKSMQDLTGDGKVLKKIITPGNGPTVADGAMVRVHYNGYLEYSGEPYDSSRLRNKEQQFTLGKGDVLLGWDVAIATMKKGELARLLVHPEYAFGDFGCPPRIPPNATILFEIEVLGFVDLTGVIAFEKFSREEKEKMSLDELMAVVNVIREEGNDYFYQGNISKAAAKYRKAINILEKRRLKDEEEEQKWKTLLVKLYLNQSLCSIRMKRPKLAIVLCRSVLDLDEKNVKAIFRMGQAYMQLSDFERSRSYLTRAGRLSPGNTEIRQELDKLDQAVRKFKAIEKTMCSKMFSSENSPTNGADDGDKERIPAEELQQYRELYQEKFSVLSSDPHMMQTIVPFPLPKPERAIIEEMASKFDLLTEMIPHSGLKVYKKLPKELQEFLEEN